jgi:membrane-associated phospholipid phosphatase
MTAIKTASTPIPNQMARESASFDLRSIGILARWPLVGLFLFIVGGLSFAGLAYNLLAQGPLIAWDRMLAVSLPAIALQSPAFVKTIMDSGFYIGKEGIIAVGALMGIYFLYRRYWTELAMLAIGLGGASAMFLTLTAIFGRVRPPTQIWIIVNLPGFPSGHAISIVVLYGLLAYLIVPKMPTAFWKAVVITTALLMIGFIGFSRVFTGGHYLSDVLAGYALGLAWSSAVYTVIEIIAQKIRNRNVK